LPMVLVNERDSITLHRRGTDWFEISRALLEPANVISGTSHTLTLADCSRPDGVISTGDDPFTLTLTESAYPVGAKIPVTQRGAGAVTIDPAGAGTINGLGSITLFAQ